MDEFLFNQSPSVGHLGCFQSAITNEATINSLIHRYFCINFFASVFLEKIPESWLHR